MRPRFNEFHAQMGGRPYTPDFNDRLDSIMRNKKLPSEKRYEAWFLRTSWGNWCPYCCRLSDKSGDPQPLLQADAAEALGLSATRISRLTTAARRAGTLQADPAGRIIPTVNPHEVMEVEPPANERWAAVEERWRSDFPQRARREDEVDAAMELLRAEKKELKKEKLRYFKHVTNTRNEPPTPATGELFDSGHEPVADSGHDSVAHTGNDSLRTPVTPDESSNIGTRAVNIKQQQQAPAPGPETLAGAAAAVRKLNEYDSISEAETCKFLARCASACGMPECTNELAGLVVEWLNAKKFGSSVNHPLRVILAKGPEEFASWIAHRTAPHMVTVASAGAGRRDAQPREATPEEIEQHKARGTYIPPKRR